MTAPQDNANDSFDIRPYTRASLRMEMRVPFRGHSPDDVFEIMGDPNRIKDWYLLAREVTIHEAPDDGQPDFDVDFMLFGRVTEEILLWDMPRRYVYKAHGEDFPIRDYVALIEIIPEKDGGVLLWQQYFDDIEGEHNRLVLPVILPPLNKASLERLAPMIGGTSVSMRAEF